jgi:CheY-like chemotaxis protein
LQELSSAFPPGTCRVVFIDTAVDALKKANLSVAVVVDERLAGGAELCRRLRADPLTSHMPVVVRSQRAVSVPKTLADGAVLSHDVHGLVHMLQTLVPELSAPSPLSNDGLWSDEDEDALFDDGAMTVIWRRPEAAPGEVQEWPPPPPVHAEGQDSVDFALTFAGYMNSLIEALESPSGLSPEELQRVHEISHQTLLDAETCLNLVQSGVNESLMRKDLVRMKVLTSAKNSLYEKLQRLRGLASKIAPKVAPARPAPPRVPASNPAAGGPDLADLSYDDLEEESNGLAELALRSARRSKSQITLAAEAKEAANRAAAERNRAKQAERRKAVRGSARKSAEGGGGGLPGPLWMWIAIAVAAVGGSGAYIAVRLTRAEEAPRVQQANRPPQIQRVRLEQSPAGLLAQPKAADPDNDSVSFTFIWFVNGKRIPDARTARLDASAYKGGDQIEVEVRPRDSYSEGIPMRSRVFRVVGGAPPPGAPPLAPPPAAPPAASR